MMASRQRRSVPDARPLIAHIVYRFTVGGLENGVINLVNRMPADSYRHTIIALTDVSPRFAKRLDRDDIEILALQKPEGHGWRVYAQLHRLFRRLDPAIVHTRNLAALEATLPAWAAGVPVRIHGEHGRDVGDLDGSNRKYQWIRRLHRPFVTHYIALSHDLEQYLCRSVGVPQDRVAQIYNGVDAQRFHPASAGREPIEGCPFRDPAMWLVGTVGRLQPVKDQLNLVRAFIRAVTLAPRQKKRMRLVVVGDGPLYSGALQLLKEADCAELAWLPGERDDVPEILRGLDCFVLPSLAEGVSNTILEAMATGLPVVATDVGGNRELVEAGRSGELVPASDAEALAQRILAYARDPEASHQAGRAGRRRIEHQFSIEAMVQRYQGLYDCLLLGHAGRVQRVSEAQHAAWKD
jgi:sugar transferase (PEP-CTERM/EpsH1 system associated)